MSAWGWPQWVYAGLVAFGVLFALVKDGEPRTGTHSASGALLSAIIACWLLWMGGFW